MSKGANQNKVCSIICYELGWKLNILSIYVYKDPYITLNKTKDPNC